MKVVLNSMTLILFYNWYSQNLPHISFKIKSPCTGAWNPWKYLKTKVAKSRTWKYLKTKVAKSRTWKYLNSKIKVLENYFFIWTILFPWNKCMLTVIFDLQDVESMSTTSLTQLQVCRFNWFSWTYFLMGVTSNVSTYVLS